MQLASQGDLAPIHNWIRNAFGGNQVYASEGEIGREILSAKDRFGISEARVIYKAYWQGYEANTKLYPETIRGLMLAGNPASLDEQSFAEELKAERRNYRAAITRLESRVEELEAEQRSDVARRSTQFRRAVALMRRHAQDKAQNIAEEFSVRTAQALGSITETEERYRNQMGLRAPVQYWKDKAAEHKTAEDAYRKLTIRFFGLASFVIGLAAFIAGSIVLSVEEAEDRAPVYLLVAGTLLGLTTLIFWGGRLIVKLWLSEHHLRKDAAERSVMTETYLSLQEGGQASESDKAIVLGAIFRPTPDGVVKEDGPADLGLQAAISRYLAKP